MAYLVNNELNLVSDTDVEGELFEISSSSLKDQSTALFSPEAELAANFVAPDGATEINLTSDMSSEDIGGALFQNVLPTGSGTGNYDTVLAIGGNEGVVDGFTTDATSQDRNNDGSSTLEGDLDDIDFSKTIAFQLGQLTIVSITDPETNITTEYYEFRYDLNEPNNANDGEITLETFTLYTNPDGSFVDLRDMELDEDTSLIYDMDMAAQDAGIADDVYLRLDENSNGSGTDDYRVLIPVSEFAGSSPTDYVYLYVEMGRQDPPGPADLTEEGGFEEWRADLSASTITGFKFEDLDGDGNYDNNGDDIADPGEEQPMEGVVFFLDEDGDGELDFIDSNFNGVLDLDGGDQILEQWTVTDANGNYSFLGLAAGTYELVEILPDGYSVSTSEPATTLVNQTINYGLGIFDNYTSASIATIIVEEGTNTVIENIGNFLPDPGINLVKEVTSVTGGNGDGAADSAGDVVNYLITVTNTGNVDLADVSVTDPLLSDSALTLQAVDLVEMTGDLDNDGELDTDETWLYEGSYTVTQADLNANDGVTESYDPEADPDNLGVDEGFIDNLATVTADDPTSDDPLTDDDFAAAPLALNPGINLVKEVTSVTGGNGDGAADSAGDVVNYLITVTNTGNVDLADVSVTDPLLSDSALTLQAVDLVEMTGDLDNDGELDTDETWLYEGSYTVTQADLNANDGVTESYDPEADPDNLGVDEGFIDNLATVTADDPTSDDPLTDDDFAAAPLALNPGINLVKEVTSVTGGNGDGAADSAGDVVNYLITVTNTGNVDLADVSVTDPLLSDSALTLQAVDLVEMTGDLDNDGELDTDETWLYEGSYTVTQADLNANDGVTESYDPEADPDNLGVDEGFIDNLATVTADDPTSDDPLTDDDFAAAPLALNPGINLVKEVTSVTGGNGDGAADSAGDVVNYLITVTNTGNVDLADVSVTDPLLSDSALTLQAVDLVEMTGDLDNDGELDTDETWLYEGSYTVTQADLNANDGVTESYDPEADPDNLGVDEGFIDNLATVTADDPTSDDPLTDDDFAAAPLALNPGINLVKEVTSVTGGNGDGAADSAGDVVNYLITVTNTGNVDLADVSVTDPLLSDSALTLQAVDLVEMTGDLDNDGELDTDETWLYEGSYTVTQADLNANDGVTESYDPEADPDNLGVDEGFIDNLATVTADDPTSDDPLTDDDFAAAPLALNPGINLVKEVTSVTGGNGDGAADSAGDVVNYLITVTNTGNVDLADVSVTDPLLSDSALTLQAVDLVEMTGDLDNDGELDTDETWLYEGSYTVTQADLNANDGVTESYDPEADPDNLGVDEGFIDNLATVTADDPTSDDPLTDDDFAAAPLALNPGINLVKEVTSVTGGNGDGAADSAGDVVNYLITVTNTGNVDLADVSVTDPLLSDSALTLQAVDLVEMTGDLDNDGELDTDETWLYEGSYTVTQADLNANDGVTESYDPEADPDNLGVDEGFIDNLATVTADDPTSDDPLTDDDFAAAPLALNPGINLVKEVTSVTGGNGDGAADSAGDVVNYLITVTNTGNVDLADVSVTDPLLSDSALTLQAVDLVEMTGDLDNDGELDTDETWLYEGSYTVTQADLNANDGVTESYDPEADPDNLGVDEGFIDNLATVTADDPTSDDPLTDDDFAAAPLALNPGINLVKEVTSVTGGNGDGAADSAGDVVNYLITVTNTGNVDLADVSVTDPLLSDSALTLQAVDLVEMTGDLDNDGELDTDETWLYEGSYTVTQADLNANDGVTESYDPEADPDNLGVDEGFIDNLATVTADDPTSDDPLTDDDFAAAPIDQNPAISITKEVLSVTGGIDGDPDIIDSAGDIINYEIIISNDGNVTLEAELIDPILENVMIVESGGDPALNNNGLLDVGEIWTVSAEYTVTANDIASFGNEEVLTDDGTGFDMEDDNLPDGVPPDVNQEAFIDNMAVVTTQFDDVFAYDSADTPIVFDTGWFGTPGFWKNWCEFFDGISGNEPKQSGEDFFPNGEMTEERGLPDNDPMWDGGPDLDDVIVINYTDGDGLPQTLEYSVGDLKDWLDGGEGKGPKNMVDTMKFHLAALVLNIAASPSVAGSVNNEDGISPIELVIWSTEWVLANDGSNVRPNQPQWKDDDFTNPDAPSAAEMKDLIDEANNYGSVNDVHFGVDRDMEETEDVEEFIEAYNTVEAYELAVMDAMLEDKTADAFVDHYTDTKEGLSIYDTAVPKGEDIDGGFAFNFASFDGREFNTNFGEAMSYFDAADAFPMASEYLEAFETSSLMDTKFDANPAYARNLPVKDYSALNTLPQDAIAAFMKNAVMPGEVGEPGEKAVQFFDDDDQGMVNFF